MQYTIYFETAHTKKNNLVMVHIWDTIGNILDVKGEKIDDRHFKFIFNMDTEDPQNIKFKFWFPDEEVIWESSDFERSIPVPNQAEIWTFEYSARCLVKDPQGPQINKVNFHVITKNRFEGGTLFAWNPNGTENNMFTETSRDTPNDLSHFTVTLKPWMKKGFHFKLVTKDKIYEPDCFIKVWRASDGGEIWFKSGQINLQKQQISLQNINIEIIFPSSIKSQLALQINDNVDDFQETLSALQHSNFDARFKQSKFSISIYPNASYRVRAIGENITNALDVPLSIPVTNQPITLYAILGIHQWFDKIPVRDALVKVIIYPNPNSSFNDKINLSLRTGYAPKSRYDVQTEVYETVTATKQPDNTWTANFKVFADIPNWIDKLSSPDGIQESRSDGEFMSQRNFKVHSGGPTILYTADGLSGFSSFGSTAFKEISNAKRSEIMSEAFDQAIVDARIFSSGEMPHGATVVNNKIWFVIYAPHAVHADVLILEPQNQPDSNRTVKKYPMALTPDLRYYWCEISKNTLPDPKNILYRFLLNGTQETIDPASHDVTHAARLWARPQEGSESAWSIVTDIKEIKSKFSGSNWQTPSWDQFIIYELHPLRLSISNRDQTNLPLKSRRKAFQRIMHELKTGEYLSKLGVTALEFLPVNEFPKDISWGYNPAIPFAIESSYGGSVALAACVRECHDAGKSVMLDVVFNHLNESPLQAIAPDVYIDGETQWGSMVNYDHPVSIEYFKQALVYLWYAFNLDGFRFDATEAIVNGHDKDNKDVMKYIVRDGKVGSGGGWEFLGKLSKALQNASDACMRSWPYLVAENIPNNWPMNGNVLDSQWDIGFKNALGEAAVNDGDKAEWIKNEMNHLRFLHEMVRYGESHDECSGQELKKKRIASREKWGQGMRMAKAIGTLVLLAEGVPMLFMGEEAGETETFHFGMSDLGEPSRYLDLLKYQDSNTENNKVLCWFNHILGLRKNRENGFWQDDNPFVWFGPKTVSFTRSFGRFFIIVTLGTGNAQQNLGALGIPAGHTYKEIFNSSWPSYQVNNDYPRDNGGYDAHLNYSHTINLPEIGAVILERR